MKGTFENNSLHIYIHTVHTFAYFTDSRKQTDIRFRAVSSHFATLGLKNHTDIHARRNVLGTLTSEEHLCAAKWE